MEYPKLKLGGITTYLRAAGDTWASLPVFTLPLVVEILDVTTSTWRYMKRELHSNRNTNRMPLNQLRRVSQPHLVLRCYPSLPTPGAVGIPGQAQQYMCEDLTTISRRPHYPTLRFRNIWASLTHLALFEYPGSSRCTLQSLRT